MSSPDQTAAEVLAPALTSLAAMRAGAEAAGVDLKTGRCVDHHWSTHIHGGHRLHVRQCTLCGGIDWGDLDEQLDSLLAGADELRALFAVQWGADGGGDRAVAARVAGRARARAARPRRPPDVADRA